MYTYINICSSVHISIYANIYIYMHLCEYKFIYTCMYIYLYSYIAVLIEEDIIDFILEINQKSIKFFLLFKIMIIIINNNYR